MLFAKLSKQGADIDYLETGYLEAFQITTALQIMTNGVQVISNLVLINDNVFDG